LRIAKTGARPSGLERGGQPRQVAVDELALQGDRRGRHHDGGRLGHRVARGRDEVGERLPGARPGLDRQVLAGLDGALDGLCHGDLPGPFGAADVGDGRGEQPDTSGGYAFPAALRPARPTAGGHHRRRARGRGRGARGR
jgi:hypothetical protein